MLNFFCKQWRYFLVALGFLTRVPVMYLPDFQQRDLDAALKYFPLVGMLVGALGALVYWLALQVFPSTVAVLLSMASTLYLTGAFHEDGLADSVDGIGGGWEREQMLTIMQDSRLGTYGAVALFGTLLLKFQSLSLLPAVWVPAVLIIAHSLSRLAAVWMMALTPLAKLHGKSKPLATELSKLDLCVANGFGAVSLLIFGVFLSLSMGQLQAMLMWLSVLLLSVGLVAWWWRQKVFKHLGGYTGDTLGAVQQLTELTLYLVVLAWSGMQ
jgi:adenosylcobinamide-GDP ribazoletransferase